MAPAVWSASMVPPPPHTHTHHHHHHHPQPQVDAEVSLLASRLEVAMAELEGERANHRREMRKKAREVQEVRWGTSGRECWWQSCGVSSVSSRFLG